MVLTMIYLSRTQKSLLKSMMKFSRNRWYNKKTSVARASLCERRPFSNVKLLVFEQHVGRRCSTGKCAKTICCFKDTSVHGKRWVSTDPKTLNNCVCVRACTYVRVYSIEWCSYILYPFWRSWIQSKPSRNYRKSL